MKNKRSVYVNFTKLSSYIKKCFKDAYESLELPFNENSIETEYILIEDHDGLFHFYPIFDSSTLIETDAGYITVKDKLTITYCNVSTKEYIDSRNTCKHSYCIPSKSLENWVDFKELWYKTFDMEICPYKILHSKGVKRL